MENFWKGYADGQPSESIQKHELSSLAVSVIFPYSPNEHILELPVKQYKDYKQKNKAARTNEFIEWLIEQKEQGLELIGFSHAHEQEQAANFGLKFLEELPNTKVEKHFDSYRLFFGDKHIGLPQAVALQYYFFTINFGALRAALKIKEEDRRLLILMDRFSDRKIENKVPGEAIPPTPGALFLDYLEKESKTGIAIVAENKSINLDLRFGTLDWWKWKDSTEWKKGKTHPHFILPDWMAAASSATQFPDEYIASFDNEDHGKRAVASLNKLHDVFKSFDIWSMDGKALEHIVPTEKLWEIPDDAREFILSRARRDD